MRPRGLAGKQAGAGRSGEAHCCMLHGNGCRPGVRRALGRGKQRRRAAREVEGRNVAHSLARLRPRQVLYVEGGGGGVG